MQASLLQNDICFTRLHATPLSRKTFDNNKQKNRVPKRYPKSAKTATTTSNNITLRNEN